MTTSDYTAEVIAKLDKMLGEQVYVENRLHRNDGDPQTCWSITGKLEKQEPVEHGEMPYYEVLHRDGVTDDSFLRAQVTFPADKVRDLTPAATDSPRPHFIEVETP